MKPLALITGIVAGILAARLLWRMVFVEEPEYGCACCSDEVRVGPCFGPGRCFADPPWRDVYTDGLVTW
jgi:hypothetical protein